MKVLILQDDFPPQSFGGAGIVAFNLAKATQELGHDVCVVTVTQTEGEAGETQYEGLRVYKIYSNYHERWRAYVSLYNPQVVGRIKEIMSEFKPDVVHAHNVHSHLSYYAPKLAKQAGARVFLTAHDAMLFHYGKAQNEGEVSAFSQLRKFGKRYNPFRNFVIRRSLRFVDKIFVVSSALERALHNNGIYNTEVIHNGIDVGKWDLNPSIVGKFKNRYNLEDKRVVLFGGRLSAAKGGEEAIQMLSRVVHTIPNAALLVVGQENAYAGEMKALAKKLGVEKHLCFTGWISGEDLKAAYQASDVVAVLSVYLDPFPTVVLEAMASKKPVVGTSLGGTKELVVDGVTGFVVDPKNTNELSQKVEELLSNPAKSASFGTAGYERVKGEFSLQKQVEKILSYY